MGITILPNEYTASITVGPGGITQQEYVVPRLPGAGMQLHGTGEVPVTTMSGVRGAIDVTFVTGAAGVARAVAFLVDASGTRHIGIGLDTTNHVIGTVSVDGIGTVLAQNFPLGPALPAGVQVRARLVFDSTAAVEGSSYVAISVDGVITNMQTTVTTTWTPFRPTALLVGSGAGLGAYNGQRAPFVQLSEQAAPATTRVVGRTASFLLSADLSSSASTTPHVVDTVWEARFDRLSLSTGSNGAEAAAFLATRHLGFSRLSTASIEVAPATFVTVPVDVAGIGDNGTGRGLVLNPGNGTTRWAERFWYNGPPLQYAGRCSLLMEFVAVESLATAQLHTPYLFSWWGNENAEILEAWIDDTTGAVTTGFDVPGWPSVGSPYQTTPLALSWVSDDHVRIYAAFGDGPTLFFYSVNGGAWVDLDPGRTLPSRPPLPADAVQWLYFGTFPHLENDPDLGGFDYTLAARIQSLAVLMPGEEPVP